MRNQYDSICFNCGNHTAKGAGHPEKTNHSHKRRGIPGTWLVRCTKCVRMLQHPKAVESILKNIKGDAIKGLHHFDDVWFDNNGKGHVKIEIRPKGSKPITLTTTVSSNKPNSQELEEKRNKFKRHIESVKSYLEVVDQ